MSYLIAFAILCNAGATGTAVALGLGAYRASLRTEEKMTRSLVFHGKTMAAHGHNAQEGARLGLEAAEVARDVRNRLDLQADRVVLAVNGLERATSLMSRAGQGSMTMADERMRALLDRAELAIVGMVEATQVALIAMPADDDEPKGST